MENASCFSRIWPDGQRRRQRIINVTSVCILLGDQASQDWHGCRVLELGSGCGLVSSASRQNETPADVDGAN